MRRLLVLLTLAALTVTGCGLPGHNRSHQQIGTDAARLRAAFNASAADTRVLALVSPTCGTCLLGATTMENDVFAKISSTRLRGFIVWVPKLGAHQDDVAGGDPHRPRPPRYPVLGWHRLPRPHPPAILGLGEDAWDVYLLTALPPASWVRRRPLRPRVSWSAVSMAGRFGQSLLGQPRAEP
jgi:hypothetical protein